MAKNILINQIFQRLYFQESQSVSELGQWLHKSNPSVSKIIQTLIQHQCVQANGLAPSTGGRRATQFSIVPDYGYIVAISMDQLFTTIALFNLERESVSASKTIDLNLHTTENALETLIDITNTYIAASSLPKEKIIGVGIAMPGLIKPEEGRNYTFFDQNTSLTHREILAQGIDLPVFIDNDSSLTALAEWTFGKAKGHKNAMIINIGWGTGLGMIVDGELFRGESGYAGEFSHIPIHDNGKLCECGKRGCLETETSLLIMAEEAIKEIQGGVETGIALKEVQYMSDEIIEAALNGNEYCIHLLAKIGKALGKGIGILIQIMNPGMVLLSGRGAKAERILKSYIDQAITANCIPKLAEKTKLSVSDLGLRAPLLGAAALVIENTCIQEIIHPGKTNKIPL